MVALNIRDIGEGRKAALDAEAKAQGISLSELVRRLLDEGVARAHSVRQREEWLASARTGLAFESETLRSRGPSLARYRNLGDDKTG